MADFDQEPQEPGQPAQEPGQLPVRTAQDQRDYYSAYETRQEFDKAAEAQDWDAAGPPYRRMQQQAAMSTVSTISKGGDPAREIEPIGSWLHSNIELSRRQISWMRRRQDYEDFKQNDPEMQQLRQYFQGVQAEYRERNKEALPEWRPGVMTPEQRLEFMGKLQPVRRDPMEVADMRMLAVQVNNRMKEIDPVFSLWSDPATAGWAGWINREAGDQGLGYLQSAPEKAEMGFIGRAAYIAAEAIETITDPALRAGYQLWEWTDQLARGMGIPSISPPINYIEGPNGEIWVNQERPHPGFFEAGQSVWSMATGQSVIRAVARNNRVRQQEQFERSGGTMVLHGVANVAGIFLGFGLPAGYVMTASAQRFGRMGQKGMEYLGGLGITGATSARALQLVEVWAPRFGAAAGLGGMQATMYGKQQGYLNQFIHGVAMYPALAIMGHYGPRFEKVLNKVPKMPPKVAQMLSEGMVMGIPFGTLETLEVSLWQHLRNPNESTLQIYLKNVLGAMMFKGAFGGPAMSPMQQGMFAARLQVERGVARAAFAEDVATGRMDPSQVLKKRAFSKLDEQDLRRLGDIILRKKAAEDIDERLSIQEEQFAFEKELDVKQYGLGGQLEEELEAQGAEQAAEGDVPMRKTEFIEPGEPGVIRDTSPEVERRERDRRRQRIDPLEEPDYIDRPEAERRIIEAAESTEERKIIADAFEQGAGRYQVRPSDSGATWEVTDTRTGTRLINFKERGPAEKWAKERYVQDAYPEERREGQRRGEEPTEELAMPGPQAKPRRVPTRKEARRGAKAGTGSMMAGAMAPEADPGAKRVFIDEILAEMRGRRARKGVRIPFTGVRVGRKEGDPVRIGQKKGRIKPRQAIGLFKIFEALVRTEGGQDIVIHAHEWSHAMQRFMQSERGGKAFTDAAKAWAKSLSGAERAEFELILEGYHNWRNLPVWRQAMEVWAEWHARDLLGDSTLDVETPALSKYFRRQMMLPENAAIRAQYERIQELIRNYTLMGAEARVDASIQNAEDIASESLRATQPTKLEQARDTVLHQFFDDIVQLKRITAEWLDVAKVDPGEVNIMDDPGRLWDAYRMKAYKQTEQYVMKGITTPGGQHVEGMRQILKREGVKGFEREFRNYLVAVLNSQRVMQNMKRIRAAVMEGKRPPNRLKTSVSLEDYVSTVNKLQRRHPEFRKAARDMKKWTDTIVEWVGETGNISQAQVKAIQDAYVVWVPFFRIMEGQAAHIRVSGRKAAPPREAISRVRGGGMERIQDPLVAMFDAIAQQISNAYRTQVVASMYKMAVGREAGGMATVVPKKKVPQQHPLRQILDAIERQVDFTQAGEFFFEGMVEALDVAGALDANTLTLFAQKVIPSGERNVIAFTPRLTEAEMVRTAHGDSQLLKILRRNNDKSLWLEIEPKVYESLMGLDIPPISPIFENNFLGNMTRLATATRRFFATGVQPAFTVANFFRDSMSYPMFTQDGKFSVVPGGGFLAWIHGAYLYHFKNRGDPNSIREIYDVMGVRISSFLNEGTRRAVVGEASNVIEKTSRGLRQIQDWFAHPENYIRIHEFERIYKQAKAENKGELEARTLALEAGQEIMVNFARGGFVARFINQMTPYFNASLQGQRKLYRQIAFGGDGKNDAERGRIQRAAVWNGFMNITVPSMILWWMNKDEEWYQDLPEWRKLGFFNIYLNEDFIISLPKPFEAGIIFGGVPEAMMNWWQMENGRAPDLWTVFQDGLFPYMKGPGAFLPALIQPVIEAKTDFDFFKDRPLTPDWLEANRVPELQSTWYTTETAKILSKVFPMSPIEIEKIIGGYTSGMGTQALRALEEVSGIRDHPGLAVNPMSRFFPAPHRAGHFQSEMYRISRKLDQVVGSDQDIPGERGLRTDINRMKTRFTGITESVQRGAMSASEGEALKYRLARPLVERYDRIHER